ncbi:MAG TPA: KTSC domain-containing protein [Verrucomicrobiae bacterium]|nr:KTSC domain-containing protein [Verrucomicrobiae bacterium]
MDTQIHAKLVSVEADLLESIGYEDGTRILYLKMRTGETLRFDNVPRFRYQGLLASPRKDAYYKAFVHGHFISRQA